MHHFFSDPQWDRVRLGGIAKIGSGGTPSSLRKDFYGGEVYWVQLQDLNNGIVMSTQKTLTQDGLQSISKNGKTRPLDTILVAKLNGAGPQGKLGILGVPAATNVEICCIEPNRDKFLPPYLIYYITYIRHTWADYASRTRREYRISNKAIRETKVVLPSIEKQERIIDALKATDNRIGRLKSEKDHLEAVVCKLPHFSRGSSAI